MTIIGARPQFIKASIVSQVIRRTAGLEEIIVHTGQHFDTNMSRVFFDQLQIAKPDYFLDINGGLHGEMTGRMLIEVEKVMLKERPDCVLVYGDTNSTLAGALAAAKLDIPIAHVEAGLRSYNRKMPEETNRVLTDHLSGLLLCPTERAVENLRREGITRSVVNTGDVMLDSTKFFSQFSVPPASFTAFENCCGLEGKYVPAAYRKGDNDFILATLHRAENTNDVERLHRLMSGLNEVHRSVAPVVIPLHPRTRTVLKNAQVTLDAHVIEPVGYMEMLWLLQRCGLVITDSGGLQKEAFFFNRFCVTMRDQTEWLELVELGANVLIGSSSNMLVEKSRQHYGETVAVEEKPYGVGDASHKVVQTLSSIK